MAEKQHNTTQTQQVAVHLLEKWTKKYSLFVSPLNSLLQNCVYNISRLLQKYCGKRALKLQLFPDTLPFWGGSLLRKGKMQASWAQHRSEQLFFFKKTTPQWPIIRWSCKTIFSPQEVAEKSLHDLHHNVTLTSGLRLANGTAVKATRLHPPLHN